MRMDTETISYVLEGHELQNDVQTMIQVFLANRHYIRTDTVTDAEITVKSEMKEGMLRQCFIAVGRRLPHG